MVIAVKGNDKSDSEEIGQRLAKHLKMPYFYINNIGDFPAESDKTQGLWQKTGKPCVVSGRFADILPGTAIRIYIYDFSSEQSGVHTPEGQLGLLKYDLLINKSSLSVEGTIELANQFVALKLMQRHPAKKGNFFFRSNKAEPDIDSDRLSGEEKPL